MSKDRSADNNARSSLAGCCGGPAPSGVAACCIADAQAKAAGAAGCGCGTARSDLPVAVIGAGVKSYGRAPTFLMATGFEQARSVVAAIAGDLEAADRVELDLPETGVCGIGAAPTGVVPQAVPAAAQTASGCGPAACGTTGRSHR